MEAILEVLIEIFLQIAAEFLAEMGLRKSSRASSLDRSVNFFVAAIGYALLAGILGWFSLYLAPEHFIQNLQLRYLNLVLTPILVGSLMAVRGQLLRKKAKELVRLDSLSYGFLFAFTFALVRFLYAKPG